VSAQRERFSLTLEAPPDGGAPGPIRLKRFLKMALRAYGLRCTSAVELHEDTPPAEPSPVPMEDSHVPA
jgi:hypothetical protein